jgi:hypothetical protein
MLLYLFIYFEALSLFMIQQRVQPDERKKKKKKRKKKEQKCPKYSGIRVQPDEKKKKKRAKMPKIFQHQTFTENIDNAG